MAETNSTLPPTLDDLARRYLDLWQEQWAALAADPETAEHLARLFQMLGQGAASFAPFVFGPGGFAYGNPPGAGWNPRPPPDSNQARAWQPPFTPPPFTPAPAAGDDGAAAWAAAPAGPASARPASGDGDGDVAELTRRLAVLEERLHALEGGAGAEGPRAERPGRGGRSRGSGPRS